MDSSIYLIAGGAVVVIFIIGFMFSRKQAKQFAKQMEALVDFEAIHPEFAKVFYVMKSGLKDKVINVHKINGIDYMGNPDSMSLKDISKIKHSDTFQQIVEGKEMGFYILPGTVTLNVSYVTSREGVIYDSVTKYTDALDIVVEIEPNKSYLLDFDEKKKTFTFTERV